MHNILSYSCIYASIAVIIDAQITAFYCTCFSCNFISNVGQRHNRSNGNFGRTLLTVTDNWARFGRWRTGWNTLGNMVSFFTVFFIACYHVLQFLWWFFFLEGTWVSLSRCFNQIWLLCVPLLMYFSFTYVLFSASDILLYVYSLWLSINFTLYFMNYLSNSASSVLTIDPVVKANLQFITCEEEIFSFRFFKYSGFFI